MWLWALSAVSQKAIRGARLSSRRKGKASISAMLELISGNDWTVLAIWNSSVPPRGGDDVHCTPALQV